MAPAETPDARLYDRNASISVLDEMKKINPEELKWANLRKVPCVTKSLLYGSLAGAAVGISRYVRVRSIRSTGNWAILATGLVSIGSWEFCRFQRRLVLNQLARVTVEDHEASLPPPLPMTPLSPTPSVK
ncbi:hypothetical protein SeMB42_g06010 [Synchytrium endobioticum]|uniref:Cytochrome c oxidase assembly protein COX20, mitochondrial n=1 Tax=Synchytrium endobioticum TaxID=286115 RepID=A0A507DBF0_9FUNG|nr:hypothetical protein SeMB42_g06010 [Synchytrium endobioticum]TPX48904.1 hypothetical protein SeLEV6574_g01782 [Synchytrium endobioticum]